MHFGEVARQFGHGLQLAAEIALQLDAEAAVDCGTGRARGALLSEVPREQPGQRAVRVLQAQRAKAGELPGLLCRLGRIWRITALGWRLGPGGQAKQGQQPRQPRAAACAGRAKNGWLHIMCRGLVHGTGRDGLDGW